MILDSRFGRCGVMTSIPNWSDMTDSTIQPAAITTGLGASPSQTKLGDDHIAEFSDVFREAIKARNIYAAWARKLTNAKPSDPDVCSFITRKSRKQKEWDSKYLGVYLHGLDTRVHVDRIAQPEPPSVRIRFGVSTFLFHSSPPSSDGGGGRGR
ncbi:hypothetical protein TNCV_3737751 [Trichonephila clavipes]|nr:hypothetical protein TNCV_3737751 [Trichonephila clavipes]